MPSTPPALPDEPDLELFELDFDDINKEADEEWRRDINQKIEDVLTLDLETLLNEPREVFMFLLGEEAKRVARLEAIAECSRRVVEMRGGVMKPAEADLQDLEQAVVNLSRYEAKAKERVRLRREAAERGEYLDHDPKDDPEQEEDGEPTGDDKEGE